MTKFVLAGFALWLAGSLAGAYLLVSYKETPGAAAVAAPPVWPTETRVERDPARRTLVMVLHPKCTCSRASLGELAKLLDRAEGQVTTRLLFVRPKGVSDEWLKSDTWAMARGIRNATVVIDPDGQEAARFGANVSGQAYLYSVEGRLLFAGGITQSRGHYGDNAGSSAILAILKNTNQGSAPEITKTNVFGCELADEDQRTAAHAGGSSQ